MRLIFSFIALLLCLWLSPAVAAEPAQKTVGQVKLELLKQLEADGYLSAKLSTEAKTKYVRPEDLQVPLATVSATEKHEPSFMERYVTWQNVFRLLGVVVLLVAFGAFIAKIGAGLIFVIAAVPKEIYQTTFLTLGSLMTFRPEMLWASQAYYLALFGSIANLIVLGWTLESHPRLMAALKKLLIPGIPAPSVISFFGMLYFGGLALMYQSEVFGFAAAVGLSGILSFYMHYGPGILTLGFHDKATPAVVLGHLVVLAGYCAAKATGQLPAQAALFAVGLEYYCTIAMGVGFLIGASPFRFRRNSSATGYLALFLLVAFVAISGYHFYDLKVVGSIVCVFGVLLALEWIGYLSYKTGFVIGTFVLGAMLYGSSLLLEHYGHLIVLKLA